MDYKNLTEGYSKNNYFQFFKGFVLIYKPKTIIEIGIGEGYSLSALIAGIKINKVGTIRAYDIFDKWLYYHKANYSKIKKKFDSDNVHIIKGDFFKLFSTIKDNSIDLLNIGIPMDGDAYNFFFDNYLKKLSKNGIALLEGGSEERDNVHWMKRYNKKLIRPVLMSRKDINFFIIEPFPSITIIKRKEYA